MSTVKPALSPLPKGYDTLTYVTPEIAKRFPKEAPPVKQINLVAGQDTLTYVTPEIAERFPDKTALPVVDK